MLKMHAFISCLVEVIGLKRVLDIIVFLPIISDVGHLSLSKGSLFCFLNCLNIFIWRFCFVLIIFGKNS